MFIISPSVLAADFSKLGDEVKKVYSAGAEYIHLVVMDGIFVPNISFGAPIISAIRKSSEAVFDVHLMITEPQRYIDDFVNAGADLITIHYESCDDPAAVLGYIRSKGVRSAVAIKPNTDVSVVYPLLGLVDMVLIMTVEPGYGGQALIPETLEKVRKIKAEIEKRGLNTIIQVDGGINADNAEEAKEAGADILVAGSAVFGHSDRKAAIEALR